MKHYLKYLNLWSPVLFAGYVGYTAYFSLTGGTTLPLFASFFLWIPMAFFFSAAATQYHVSKLEKRIETLEKEAKLRPDQISN